MRIAVVAVGRLRPGPERTLIEDWLGRADRAGRSLGLTGFTVVEVEDKRGGGPAAEAALLGRAAPSGARRIALDERGLLLSSPDFADRLATWRDSGTADTALFIGGADGLDPAFVGQADLALSFGPMVWPHMLARAMLAEQLYRAVSILAGTPYHRA